jgi:hypothetical protein
LLAIEVMLKSTLLVGAAAIVNFVLPRASPATRH